MRKRYWVLMAFLALGGIGNLIGGTDTPVRGSVEPQAGATGPATAPATAGFDAVLYVSASSLNLRAAPGTDARVLASLPRNARVLAGERRGNWVNVSSQGVTGWASGDYLSATPIREAPIRPAPAAPRQNQSPARVVQAPSGSCPSRRYCTQIASCQEAQYYLANCSWGWRLDGDSDGVPCESLCR
jgi:hypothetical protein